MDGPEKMKEKIKVENILSWTNCRLVSGDIKKSVGNISTDSRTIGKGDFLTVRGPDRGIIEAGSCNFEFFDISFSILTPDMKLILP